MKKSIGKTLVALLLGFAIFFAAYQAVAFANRPLAEPLILNPAPKPAVQPAVAKKVAPAPGSLKTCGNTGTTTILFIGTGVDGNVDNADAVRIVKVDYDLAKITVVAVPRDLWVESGDPDVGESKLGPVYEIKKRATNGSEKHKDTVATSLIAQILQDTFDLTPDQYFTVDVLPWGEMIDTIGGVEVDLPEDFVTTDGTVLKAGKQLLDGEKSKDYVRMMAPAGDLGRVQRQDVYIQGLRAKMLDIGILAKAPELYKQFDKAIITDLTPKQLTDLACMVETVPAEEVTVYEFTPDLVTASTDGALLPDIAKITAFLKEVLYIE